MAAPDVVLELVERFARNRAQYLNPAYNETQVRREFLDPFFTALGWDVENTSGHAQQYKDVVHEDAIKVGLDSRAPDYSFRIGGQRKFFVEAKKPAVNLKDDPAPAYQLRRYSWSAKLPLGVLTDFQEFAVYDGRVKPAAADKPSVARTLYVPYEQYEERWDEIAGVFGKEAILQGSFDRYAESTKAKKGTAEVDKAFLGEIELWRDALARNIALRNPSLSQRELNFAVQATIDRLIFLRICEDRGIEPYGRLQGLCNGGGTYGRLTALFYEADQRYNSGLFHFADEKGRAGYADRLTLGLSIDDKPLKDILKRLYYPESPYEFSVLPADILGQVYEQFLGKVIRLTAGHRAVVEDKPEVKKAGGVYYTPTYIVDYIVKHTVGRLLEGLTPKQAAELRILDPACGSGSFLIGAYQYLLDWHRDWYVADQEKHGARKHAKALYQGRGGEWRLTTAERKRILLNSIYGVDIDAQAVETTKLSLLLKVLEGETSESIDAQLSFLHERALPDLAANIKCGNSLIGPDFYDDQQLGLAGLDEDERYRINVFDWEAEFPEILGRGVPEERRGFDVVIGNPPYIRIQNLKEFAPREVEFYKRRYVSASKGNYDIYVVFVERGLSLLNVRGLLGYILPHKFLTATYGEQLRTAISCAERLDEVVHFADGQVFAGATTYTCLLLLSGDRKATFKFTEVPDLAAWQADSSTGIVSELPAGAVSGVEWRLIGGRDRDLYERLQRFPKLGEMARLFVGLQTSADPVFVFTRLHEESGGIVRVFSKAAEDWIEIESALLKPVIRSGHIGRYTAEVTARVLFPYSLGADGASLIDQERMATEFPRSWSYLSDFRQRLTERERGRFAGDAWYQLYPKNLDRWEEPKLLLPYMIRRLAAHLDEGRSYFVNVTTGGFGLQCADNSMSLACLAALLNSRLLDWYLKRVSTNFRSGYFGANKQFLVELPILKPDAVQSDLEALEVAARTLSGMQALMKAARTAQESAQIQREFDALDRRLDGLVYDLYGLTDDEIAIVERSVAPI